MAKCSICAEEEILPFTCSYCQGKFCRKHHLPEKHGCTGLTKNKWQPKKFVEKPLRGRAWTPTHTHQTKGKISGIHRAGRLVEKFGGKRKTRSHQPGYIEISEKQIAAAILLLILILGALSRFL